MGIKSLGSGLLGLLFPPKCPLCGSLLSSRYENCDCPVDRLSQGQCPLCTRSYQNCNCQLSFVQVRSPLQYRGTVKSAILQLKTKPSKSVADYFAKEMNACFQEHLAHLSFSALVPVPMNKSSRRARGFNQSEILAKRLSPLLDLPVQTKALLRSEFSKAQHSLGKVERMINAVDSYTSTGKVFFTPTSRLLLIDDVCTTGATLHACGHALKAVGAGEVYALTASGTFPLGNTTLMRM